MLDQPTIGTRLTRSASQPIGTAPSTKNADDAVAMKTIAPSLIPNVRWISGPSTLMAAPSSSSNASRSPSTMNMSLPPARNASVNDTGSELTPGRSSSGKMTCSRERLCASSRASSSSRTAAASDAALPSPPCASSTMAPQPASRSVDRSFRDRIFPACHAGTTGGYCRCVACGEAPQVFGPGADDRAALVRHFRDRGWAVVDALTPAVAAAMPGLGRRGRNARRRRERGSPALRAHRFGPGVVPE